MSGRLTLTWANKDKALLSHGESGYEWVDKDDPRAREVRLLDELGRVGEVAGDPSDNLLIRGDSLDALRALVHSPEYAAVYRGKVKLVYIDPPFNTGQAFEHYDDSLEHSVWLGMMRERLVLIRDLLAPDGSVWVHLDDAEMAYCRVLMDEVFGRQNFVATFIWERTDIPAMQAEVSMRHDYLLVFKRSELFVPHGFTSDEVGAHYDKVDKDGRLYCLRTLRMTGPGSGRSDRPTMWFAIEAPDGSQVLPYRSDGSEGRWRWGPDRVEESADQLEWVVTKSGSYEPFRRIYADTSTFRPPETLLRYGDVGSNRVAKYELKKLFAGVTPFATPKPERLLERVIHIGSSPGDIVLDCFAGSGTTAAVAHKMGRRWVTAELNENTADTFTKPRLEKVVAGTDPGGITESVGWQGGGGFRDLRVAASVWQVISDEHGTVALQADEVDRETLRRAVAAQLGYLPVEEPMWAGAKGRSRLAVVEGVVDAVVVADIVSALGERQTALIAALAATHDAEMTLKELSRGSRILRLPIDLFPTLGLVTR